jgi:hypothetical protein
MLSDSLFQGKKASKTDQITVFLALKSVLKRRLFCQKKSSKNPIPKHKDYTFFNFVLFQALHSVT